jgi:hypothetical protein
VLGGCLHREDFQFFANLQGSALPGGIGNVTYGAEQTLYQVDWLAQTLEVAHGLPMSKCLCCKYGPLLALTLSARLASSVACRVATYIGRSSILELRLSG